MDKQDKGVDEAEDRDDMAEETADEQDPAQGHEEETVEEVEEEEDEEEEDEEEEDEEEEDEEEEDEDVDLPDLDERILCPDGNCIGVIGPDGKCKECGTVYDGPEPLPGSEPKAGEEEEEKEEEPWVDTDDGQPPDFEERTLCSDGNCIGVIGPDGKCKECGKPYRGEWYDQEEEEEEEEEEAPAEAGSEVDEGDKEEDGEEKTEEEKKE